MRSKIKNLIKTIIYWIVDRLVFPSKKIQRDSLLLIRLDGIGDYVLFRDFIKVLKESPKYHDKKITILGNSAWKSVAKELDGEFIHHFIWLNKPKFSKSLLYRFIKLREITSYGYEIIVSPVYSRDFFVSDAISKLVNAHIKIGSSSDLSNLTKWQRDRSDKYYDILIETDDRITFEFYRNREFFEKALGSELTIEKPMITLKVKKLNLSLPKNYAVIFIGGTDNSRRWGIEKFSKISSYIREELGFEIVICGGITDRVDAAKFNKIFDEEYLDLVGKTSLIDFLHVLRNAKLLVSNETSAPHFAVALDLPSVYVISNGNHFGRFVPYPKDVFERYFPIYHSKIEQNLCFKEALIERYGHGSDLNIHDIPVQRVQDKMHTTVLNSGN